MDNTNENPPPSPGVSPVQLQDCLEELLKFTLSSSIYQTLTLDIGLSKHYCSNLLKNDDPAHTHPKAIANNVLSEGVLAYPLYKHLASALCQSISSGALCSMSNSTTLICEDNSLKEKEDEWNKLILEKGSELVKILKTIDFELHVQEPYFSQLRDGQKTIEGRCAVGNYNRIEAGALILFNKCLVLRVQDVHRYASFREMLETENLTDVLPGVETVEEGVQIYRKFYSEEKERSNGVVAICITKQVSQLCSSLATILSGLSYSGIQRILGLAHTVGTVPEALPPPRSTLLASFLLPHNPNVKGSKLTDGARALAKHLNRSSSSYWGTFCGSDTDKNMFAVDVVSRLIAHSCWLNMHVVPAHGVVFEIRVSDGYGARWSEDGTKLVVKIMSTKKDFGWKYAYEKEGESGVFCRYCHHRSKGGITRLKYHLAGTHTGVLECKQVPEDVKNIVIEGLKTFSDKKTKQSTLLFEIGKGPGSKQSTNFESEGDGASGGGVGSGSDSNATKGAMDKFVNRQPKQTTLNSALKKDLRIDACRKFGRWTYSAALPFNCVNDVHFKPAIDAIAKYGPGFKPPSMHELRTWILKEEVNDINHLLETHKNMWRIHGCTIMSDGWTDGKSRALINFLVNSPAGTFFLKSVDVSNTIKNGELIYNYIADIVVEVGAENVIQVITDNASNCKNAGKRLEEKWTHLWWTPCAAHCIDLMLEDIGELKIFKDTIEKAKRVIKFIYGHSRPLYLMREHTKGKELLRPAITRFATAFLTLQSLYKQKKPLEIMFASQLWAECSQAKKEEGKITKRLVLNDPDFWPHVAFCVKSVVPLVSVLREVDSEERPAMGYIYELMDRAKETIKFNCGDVERKYMPIWRKIDARWTPQLHHPLHAAGYYLNPQLRYEERFSNCDEVKDGLYACMDRMLNSTDRLKADIQLDFYDNQQGDFGCPMAIKSRMHRSPAQWWIRFGSKTPELMSFAVRVLGLTCSASGCERNWSTFASIHTKKRNRLEHQRLNALVYVKYNLKLSERSIRRRDKIDPIIVDEIESDDEWITEREDPVLPKDTSWLDDDELFSGDPIVSLPPEIVDSALESEVPIIDVDSSPTSKKRKVGECSSGGKGKEVRLDPVDEDEEIDIFAGVAPRIFDSAQFPDIDTLDQDDDDIILDDEDYF